MQDWEYEVACPDDLNDYFAAYTSGELSDDERFTLMEMVVDCVESGMDFEPDSPHLHKALALIEANIDLHLATVWYWASTDFVGQDPEFSWQIAPAMREILWRHRDLWE